jgi:two-component system cell cycle sensor histidine kinase/response regulator CckA
MAFRQKVGCVMIPPMVPGNSEKSPTSNSKTTILFADGNGPVQVVVAALLHQLGYSVIVASSGTDALQRAHKFDGVIHLLLADIDMPGMTGVELAIQLNQERPDTKIMLLSDLPTGMLVLNNGWTFLPKPFMADMLRDRIRDFLSEQPSIQDYLPRV